VTTIPHSFRTADVPEAGFSTRPGPRGFQDSWLFFLTELLPCRQQRYHGHPFGPLAATNLTVCSQSGHKGEKKRRDIGAELG
jgi:hypothetical protein